MKHRLVYKNKDGEVADYGRVPSLLVDGMSGIIYFIDTDFVDLDTHNKLVKEIVRMLASDSYDHGSEWRLTEQKIVSKEVERGMNSILSLVSFRIKDMY